VIVLIIKYGVKIRIGMLMAMNIDWKGDNTEIAVPALKPRKAEKILPAHVGQPTKRPVNAPTVDIVEIFRCGFETSTLSAYIFNVALIPTSTETIMANITFIGIIKMENSGFNCIVTMGT
jgi:hypothetical protein